MTLTHYGLTTQPQPTKLPTMSTTTTPKGSTVSTSTEVAAPTEAPLPSIYKRPTPAANPGERAVPIVYLMADLSKAVKARIAEPGDIVAMLASDDTDPYFLTGGDTDADSFRAFIIDYERYVTRGGAGDDWERLPSDYQRAADGSDDDVNVGFRYVIHVPGGHFPLYSLLLIRAAGLGAYKKVNFAIDQAANAGSPDVVMIEFGTATATSKKNGATYHKWTAKGVPNPDPDEQAAANALARAYHEAKDSATAAAEANNASAPTGAGF